MNFLTLRSGAILTLIAFGALTVFAVIADGPGGFPDAITHSLTWFQIWVDLVIAMIFWCAWVVQDGLSSGRNPWPWVIGALIFGALAPLIYMIAFQRWPASPVPDVQGTGSQSRRRVVAGIALALFAILTMAALALDETDLIFHRTWSSFQIVVDLMIMIVMWTVWVVRDARQSGRNPWGWVIFAVVPLSSFAPLVYMLVYARWPASHRIGGVGGATS